MDYSKVNIVPFRKTGKISDILNVGDYIDIMASMTNHGLDMVFACMKVIHMNPKYPEYFNLNYIRDQTFSIYTNKGWKECELNDIAHQLREEELQCVIYIQDNVSFIRAIFAGLKEVEKMGY